MALDKFNWQNGTQIEPAKVEIDGTSYDVVDAQFEGETPLSASNLNLMQDTILGNVKDDLIDDSKIPSIKAVKGKILWTNPNPTSSFSTQTITFASSDFDIYEVYYYIATNNEQVLTAKSIKGHGTRLIVPTTNTEYRLISATDNTNYVVGNATDNTYAVPISIVGYKTGLSL